MFKTVRYKSNKPLLPWSSGIEKDMASIHKRRSSMLINVGTDLNHLSAFSFDVVNSFLSVKGETHGAMRWLSMAFDDL